MEDKKFDLPKGQYRNWCFTAFVEPDKEKFDNQYIIYQKEKCPTTGTIHYQGYVEFKNPTRGVEAIQRCGLPYKKGEIKCKFEPRHGTQEQAIDYCKKLESKVGDAVEIGKKKKQGEHTELQGIMDAVHSGMTRREINREFGGIALRYQGMIRGALQAEHGLCPIDNHILELRRTERVLNGELPL